MAEDRENHGNALTLTEAVNEIRRLQADKEKADKENNHEGDEINDS
jgi:hypothetical protein